MRRYHWSLLTILVGYIVLAESAPGRQLGRGGRLLTAGLAVAAVLAYEWRAERRTGTKREDG